MFIFFSSVSHLESIEQLESAIRNDRGLVWKCQSRLIIWQFYQKPSWLYHLVNVAIIQWHGPWDFGIVFYEWLYQTIYYRKKLDFTNPDWLFQPNENFHVHLHW